MPLKNNNEDEIKKLGAKLRQIALAHEAKLKGKVNSNPSIAELAAEGDKIIAEEDKKGPQPKAEVSLKTTENPYRRAREIVLKKLPEWKRNEVLDQEKTGKKNHYYDDFVKDVARVGDQLSA